MAALPWGRPSAGGAMRSRMSHTGRGRHLQNAWARRAALRLSQPLVPAAIRQVLVPLWFG